MSGKQVPWTSQEFQNDAMDFQFVIMADRNGGSRPGVFENAVDKANLLRPEFVMCVGDLADGDAEDPQEIDRQWNEFEAIAEKLESPFFHVPGNNDLSNDAMRMKWKERFGPTYYSFLYGNVLFMCLDTLESSAISEAQADWALKTLDKNPNVRWTIVFMHKPIWDGKKQRPGWDRIDAALEKRPHTVFAGHNHDYLKTDKPSGKYIRLATTGGGSDLGGADLGAFDHIVWVTMTAQGPRIAILPLDGIRDENLIVPDIYIAAKKLRQGKWFEAEGIASPGVMFDEGSAALNLINPTSYTLTVQGYFHAHPSLRTVPCEFNRALDPITTQTLTLDVKSDAPLDIDSADPLWLELTGTCLVPGRDPLVKRETRPVFLDYTRGCPRVDKAPDIDGSLKDWSARFYECSRPGWIEDEPRSWSGPKDGRFRFAVACDDAFVYIAAQSFDDRVVLERDKGPWDQDCLSFHFDARPDPVRSQGRGGWGNRFKDYLAIELTAGAAPGQTLVFEADRLSSFGVKTACVKTDEGLIAETAIPVKYLTEPQGAEWKAFRLNVGMRDYDDVSQATPTLWWRPRWEEPASYAGSGTFERK